jgi:hypothetical protein
MRWVMAGWPARAMAGVAVVMAACGSGCSTGSSSGTLTVSVIREGGPITVGGQTPRDPVADAPILVTGGTQTWTAHTGNSGSATITLPPGGYQVVDPECGQGPQTVNVSAGQAAKLTFTCIVP